MTFRGFLKDKIFSLVIFFVTSLLAVLLLLAFKARKDLLISLITIYVFSFVGSILLDFFRKRKFYNDLVENIKSLDKAYLVLETLEVPNFYEGRIISQALYDIDKSMSENVNAFSKQLNDFKEYLEMWIHEIKIPITSLLLIDHNNKDKFDNRTMEAIKRIDFYVEQVLYYVRAENAEKDYLIKEVPLNKVISSVALKNKDDILEHGIDLIVENVSLSVKTDAKWLEFILNQIVNNSIKYYKNDGFSYIKIYTMTLDSSVDLLIEDNGIGIEKSDIGRVFDKSFTGKNGREIAKSTGIGLFIVKNLVEKLGHRIKIESEEGKFTRVTISFGKNDFYSVLK
ncbi:MAG: HAMP domain-containing histidine kinase [Bacilli bacterium]|nr:HAMP domain-containing histidine kinase [Bacilli bacterium]